MFVLFRKELQPNYQILMKSIVSSNSNWTPNMRYLIPGMIQFARAYITKGSKEFMGQIKTLTDIFEKALSLRLDESAFGLLNTIFTVYGLEVIKDQLKSCFIAIFTRMQNDKTNGPLKKVPLPFSNGLLLFISLIVNIHGIEVVKGLTDQVQPDIILMVFNSETDRIKSVEGKKQRLEVLSAFCKIIVGMPNLTQELFKKMLEGIIMLACSGVRREYGDGGDDEFSEDNKERIKYQQLYNATIEVYLSHCLYGNV
jgi:hypothetical protein